MAYEYDPNLTAQANERLKNPFLSEGELEGMGLGGMRAPSMPAYESAVDADGNLKPGYKMTAQGPVAMSSIMPGLESRLDGINLNKDALSALRTRGLSQGPSAWASLQKQKQGVDELDNLGKVGSTVASSYATAHGNMAGGGGVSRGARERMATNMGRDLNASRQGVRRGGELDRLTIDMADEGQKTDILKALPEMEANALAPELQKASIWSGVAGNEQGRQTNLDLSNRDYATNIEKSNLDRLAGDLTGRNQYNMGKYSEAMKGWASNQASKAIENSGK